VSGAPQPLFSEIDIAARVAAIAKQIAERKPEIAVAILAGAFVFAADLLRALSREGLDLGIEFLWLRSYGTAREGSGISVLVGASENVCGRKILLIDGVLDGGHTLAKAQQLLHEAGASSIISAVAVDKQRKDALAKSDYFCFGGVAGFIVGYGMDDAGQGRGLPYIGLAN
jgi:hypoxanthine phosphoribosyltransferase